MVTLYCASLAICVNDLICVQPLPELEVVMAWMIKLRKQWLMWTTCMLYDIIPHLVTRAIYRLRDRERVSISCHNTSLLSVWLCLAKFTLKIWQMSFPEPIMRPESGYRNASIYVTVSGLIANDVHAATWVFVCFSCRQRRCFTIRRDTRWRWDWDLASQAETGPIPSCRYQGGEKPICGIYQHEHTHTWT